ncbi:hypothetical protein K7W42_19255 [Deinococcus sp. HMF7604]|uniref:hypothetical protein n=1 Tax=Deinococcus betulae TaxID=2873312 RepID=UPI001CCDD9C4|nr:hypothetical protein [Deinococcus betulae]MBZ9752979.1 hypothetical protein [Deinococcus betulae]
MNVHVANVAHFGPDKIEAAQDTALTVVFDAFVNAYHSFDLEHRASVSGGLNLFYIKEACSEELKARRQQSIRNARRAVATAWSESLQLVTEDINATLTGIPPLHQYTELILGILRQKAVEDDIDLRDYIAVLAPLFAQVNVDKFRALLNSLRFQVRISLRFFIVVIRLKALIRLKTRREQGAGVLSMRPSAIPLTVQPCAP